MIDAVVNDWVKEIFTTPGIRVKKEIEDVQNQFDAETKRQIIFRLREMNTPVSNKMADELEKE